MNRNYILNPFWNEQNLYFGRFTDNILVPGPTGCGKTTYLQHLARNKMFSRLKSVDWISKITLTKNREEQISSCFKNTKVNFSYQNDLNEFDTLIENFQRETDDINNNMDNNVDEILGQKNFDKLIVMDNVSRLVNKSNNFGSFFIVSRKFGYNCIYFVHILYLSKANWQLILSQTKIFNISPGSIKFSSISKILSANFNRETFNYIPSTDLYLNRLYFEISNSRERICLTIDCRNLNLSGPVKDRTNTQNAVEQFAILIKREKIKSTINF